MPNNSMNFGVDLLPVTDTTYYLGSNEKRWKIFADEINGLDFNEVDPHFSLMGPTNGEASLPTWRRPNIMDLEPTIHKEYASTSQYGTTNSDETCSFYMMSVRPDAWATPWRIRFKIHSYCPAYPDRNSITWCTLTGRTDGVCYYNYNENINSGHYYIAAHILKLAGYNAGYGHAIGINIRYGNNYTNSAYYRTFEVDYYDSENCTVTFLDNAVLWDNWEGASDTNYNGFANYDAINRGLRETGDDNETGRLFAHSNYLTNGSTLRLPPYSVFGFDRTWKTQSISLYSAGYSSSTTNINTARVYNTSGFDWKKGLLITNSGSNYAVNADVNISPAVHYYAADMRYNDNCVATSGAQNLGMQNRKPIFLRGVIKSDGLFYLAPITVTYDNKNYQRAWTQDIPTAVETDGTYQYVYWFLGFPYYNSSYANGLYQFNFLPWHPMYWYNDGKFEEYNPKITKADIGLGNVENTALSTWTGSNKITTVGTITTGTWNGTTIAVANGGTGATSASGARTNLGLGAAAVKGVTDNSSNADVASSDTNLITGRTLYYQLAKKGYTTNTGTVTSVRVQASSPLQSSVNTAQSSSLDTTISFTNQNANVVLAGPSSGSSAAAPTFRALVAADIPSLDWSKIGSGKPTTLSGYGITDAAASDHTQAVNKGGTNITSYAVGDMLYASGTTTLSKLTGNTSTTQKFLAMTGTGSAGAAPSWSELPKDILVVQLTKSGNNYISNDYTGVQLATAFNNGKTIFLVHPSYNGPIMLRGTGNSAAFYVNRNNISERPVAIILNFSNPTATSAASFTQQSSGNLAFQTEIPTFSPPIEINLGLDQEQQSETYFDVFPVYTYSADDLSPRGLYEAITEAIAYAQDVVLYRDIYTQRSAPVDGYYWDMDVNNTKEVYYLTSCSQDYSDPETCYFKFFTCYYNDSNILIMKALNLTGHGFDENTGTYPQTITITDISPSSLYLPFSGGTMTGAITLANTDTPILSLGNDAGWTMNKYGNLTHRRSNANDYFGIVGGSGDFRVYYDSGNVTTTGTITTTNGNLYVEKSDYPYIHLTNASGQEIGGLWANISAARTYIRERPSAGSSYATDIVFPAAKSNGNENVYVYTSRNFSLSGTTLTITVPS